MPDGADTVVPPASSPLNLSPDDLAALARALAPLLLAAAPPASVPIVPPTTPIVPGPGFVGPLTANSIEAPLTVYFRILIAYSAGTGKTMEVALCLLSYLESFLKLRTDYEWAAVLAYHMAFLPIVVARWPTGATLARRSWTPSSRAST
ncbi:hypothetical protein B0H17DRAFT_1144963 [Mycena rosella]|uniref:Uncharacterized protein n=1 Tax=Mycena rosella TaxID=1033263 RepID=A0AAD7CSZ1_MYCRO|nr:hypothetical protein B0H17DRAFT_1144963 [Mycena rosella]